MSDHKQNLDCRLTFPTIHYLLDDYLNWNMSVELILMLVELRLIAYMEFH